MNIEHLAQALQQLHRVSDEVKASAIVSQDGIMLVNRLSDGGQRGQSGGDECSGVIAWQQNGWRFDLWYHRASDATK